MNRPRVLVAHNLYRLAGGEDSVVRAEVALLQSKGHEVETLLRHNQEISIAGIPGQLRALRDCVWSADSAEAMRALIRRFRPDVVHVHNTLASLSPSIYWAAAECGVPVVQTVHNYRLACPQGMFQRDHRICQDCLGRVPLPAILHGCYRDSRSQSFAVAAMLSVHRALKTWSQKISRYIVLSDFCRIKLIAAGLPPAKIRIKPNFATAPDAIHGIRRNEGNRDFLFVGRLSPEKGLHVLVQALRDDLSLRCTVVGEGSVRPELEGLRGLVTTGWLEKSEVSTQMFHAAALIVPSVWFEPFALVTLEALSHGLPVIASRIGSLPEMIDDGKTGLLFEAGNAADLAHKMRWVREHPDEVDRMGQAAKLAFERKYSAQVNYSQLLDIYQDAIAHPH